MRSAPRVVLDTNVVLSALLFSQGRLAPLRLAWQRTVFHPLVSKPAIEELMRALTYRKFKLTSEDQRELLGDYLHYCTTVRMPAKPPRTPTCRDAFDVAFLQLAIVGKAAYLVTGDKDLLDIPDKVGFRIIAPEASLTAIEKA